MADQATPDEQPAMESLDRITKSIANELHDGPVQWMVGAKMLCEALRMKAAKGQAISPDQFDPVLTALQRALAQSRQIMRGLDTLEVHDGRWSETLRDELTLARSTLVPDATPEIMLEVDAKIDTLPQSLAQPLYRILREAIWNALRHSHGSRVTCRVWQDDGWIRAVVSDNGTGMAPSVTMTGHWGLRSIKYRAAEVGGVANLQTNSEGTLWEIRLPMGSSKVEKPDAPS